jgi:hypothetical protein
VQRHGAGARHGPHSGVTALRLLADICDGWVLLIPLLLLLLLLLLLHVLRLHLLLLLLHLLVGARVLEALAARCHAGTSWCHLLLRGGIVLLLLLWWELLLLLNLLETAVCHMGWVAAGVVCGGGWHGGVHMAGVAASKGAWHGT